MKTKDDKSTGGDPNSDASWLERNVNVVIAGLVIACIGSLIAQLWWSPLFDAEHGHPPEFAIEELFGFEAMFGFAAFVGVVFLGTGLRLIIKRDEDYYDS
ncbi:MAG: hypothetical protein ACKVHR_14525 [Pirellulales bacterium]|jgi:uncharacterized iron-regulated membrane protein|nr:hypothetical protein [Mariniblastus sp.]|tara:strand:+ start:1169 stop:1468 length:300 start_codon:yes stop_codon:yes gene_type:complete